MNSLPYSRVVRLNQIGAGLRERLMPDTGERAAIARALDLVALDSFVADLRLEPTASGWKMTGKIKADATQRCVVSLDPLPVSIDEAFRIDLVEADAGEGLELDLDLDREDPDVIEDGQIDLGAYAVEQLALHLDPFPRKPGVEFVQPDEPGEVSPFAVLKNRLRDGASDS